MELQEELKPTEKKRKKRYGEVYRTVPVPRETFRKLSILKAEMEVRSLWKVVEALLSLWNMYLKTHAPAIAEKYAEKLCNERRDARFVVGKNILERYGNELDAATRHYLASTDLVIYDCNELRK